MRVYLDNATTSVRKPECVYKAMELFMRETGASPGRSAHELGIMAGRALMDARMKMAGHLGASDPVRIIFTPNCTEALNLAIIGTLKEDGHVIVSGMEHNSVMRPLSAMRQLRNISVSRLRADKCGLTDPDELIKAIRPETALIIMTHASNVTGAIQPVEECGRIAREHGIPFLVDAAQTAGCIPVDVEDIRSDMLAFSGHKGLMGPQGTGGLYLRSGMNPAPIKFGGTGSSSDQEIQPEILPDRYESGTPNTPGIAGLSAALDFISSKSVLKIRKGMSSVGALLYEGLENIENIVVHSPGMESNIGIFSFTVKGMDPAETAFELENRHGIMTRAGLHCAPSAHRSIGTYPDGTARAGIGFHTTADEAGYFLKSLESVANEHR